MLAYILAVLVGTGSVGLYVAAFFLPEIHRKHDFIWSGVGLFYALFLWVYAQQVTGGILVGQATSVVLLGWFAWQTIRLRRQLVPIDFAQRTLRDRPATVEPAKSTAPKAPKLTPEERAARVAKAKASAAKTAQSESPTPTATAPSAKPERTAPNATKGAQPTTRPAAAPTAPTQNPNTSTPARNPNTTATPARPPAARIDRAQSATANPNPSQPAATKSTTPESPEPKPPTDLQTTAPEPSLPVTIEVKEAARPSQSPKPAAPPQATTQSQPSTAHSPQPEDTGAWIKLETAKQPPAPPKSASLGAAIQPPTSQPQSSDPNPSSPLPQTGNLDALLDEIESSVKADLDRTQSPGE